MQTKTDQNTQTAAVIYYVVCPPFFVTKALDIDFIFEEAQNWLGKKNFVSLYEDKEQAKMAASQFAAREIPPDFHQHKETHVLAKPVLCIALDSPLELPQKHKEKFFMENRQIILNACMVNTANFKNGDCTQWTILFNDRELLHPNRNESAHSTNMHSI